MSDNIEKVLERGEKLDLLVDKTDNLMFEVSGGMCITRIPAAACQFLAQYDDSCWCAR